MNLSISQNKYAILKLKPAAAIPAFLLKEHFVSMTRTEEELSIVLNEALLNDYIDDITCGEVYRDFKIIKLEGPLDPSMVAILSKISGVLADIGVSVFALSTFLTDYLLIPATAEETAIEALTAAGYIFN